MTIYIVIVNDEVDEVFDDIIMAQNHVKNKLKKWNLCRIVTKEVRSL